MKNHFQNFLATITVLLIFCIDFTAQSIPTFPGSTEEQKIKPGFCPQEKQIEWAKKNIPDYDLKVQQREETLKQIIENIKSKANKKGDNIFQGGTFTVPVAVHVIYDGSLPAPNANISYAQILSQITAMNNAFANLNIGTGLNPLTIRFCLAQTPPTGISWSGGTGEPGVVRYNNAALTRHTFYNPPDRDALRNLTIKFNPLHFLNIYVVSCINDGATGCVTTGTPGGIAGYSALPIEATNPAFNNLDGIVVDYRVFGIQSGSSYYMPYFNAQTGRVMVHELGHYFDLYHTFHGGCLDPVNDNVADTPPTNPNSGCPAIGSTLNCNSNPVLTQDYMDYTDSDCWTLFTPGQAIRMEATLMSNTRNELVSSNNLTRTGLDLPGGCSNSALLSNFIISNTQVCTNQQVIFNNFPTPNTAVTWEWTFTNNTTGAVTTFTSTATTFTNTFTVAGAYTVQLIVRDASGNQRIETKGFSLYVSVCNPITSPQGNWFFGTRNLLNFNSGTPIATISSSTAAVAVEGSASVSDVNGNLLFYTNGLFIWDANDNLMNGMTSSSFTATPGRIGFTNNSYSSSATQGALIVPNPSNTSQYFVFTVSDIDGPNEYGMPEPGLNRGIRYSVIDMALTGGGSAGDFAVIDQPITGTDPIIKTTEHLAAAPSCDGGFWIVTHGANMKPDNRLLAFKLEPNGTFNPVPVPSTSFSLSWEQDDLHFTDLGSFGHIDFSPDNTMMAITVGQTSPPTNINMSHCRVYSFNSTTGTFTSISDNLIGQYGVSFSPNSRVLYTHKLVNSFEAEVPFIQYDLSNFSASNPNPPYQQFGTTNGSLVNLQIAPDNKIYMTQFNQKNVSVINFPDIINQANNPNLCGFNPIGVSLDGTFGIVGWRGLPNMIDARMPNPATPDFTFAGASCFTFTFNAVSCGANSWNFGDPGSGANNVSTLQNPQHTFSTTGTFTVTLSVNGGPPVSHVINIPLLAPPVIAGLSIAACGVNPARLNNYSVQGFNPNFIYNWTVTGGTPATKNNSSNIDINWDGAAPLNAVTLTQIHRATGCSSSVTMNVLTCCGGNFTVPSTGLTINTSFPMTFNKIAVNGDITINAGGIVIIDCPNMMFNVPARITVNSGGILIIRNASHLHACNDMWNGIWVNAGGILTINENSRIEDALTAVVSIGGGLYSINTAIFNKNYKSLVVLGFNGYHPGRIYNTIITSRDLPNNVTVAGIKNNLNSFSPKTLRFPYLMAYPLIGVEVTGVLDFWVGSTSASNTNYFDNLNCGVWSNSTTNIRVFNNKFSNIVLNPPCPLPPEQCPPADPGIGAFPIVGAAVDANTGTIFYGGTNTFNFNTFQNCLYGFYVRNYSTVRIERNTFTEIHQIAIRDEASVFGSIYGGHTINFNTITNAKRGIYKVVTGPSYVVNNPITINNNTITNTLSSPIASDEGIFVESFGVTGNTMNAFTRPVINTNTISNTKTGIWLRNYDFAPMFYSIGTNTITPIAPSGSTQIYGIRITSSDYNTVSFQNKINGMPDINVKGISVENSIEVDVESNTINTCGLGINIFGSCLSGFYRCNKLSACDRGFTLDNSMILSPQGGQTAAGMNQWLNSTTYDFNGVGVLQAPAPVFWCLNSAGYFPILLNPPIGLVTINSASFGSCSPNPPITMEEPAKRMGSGIGVFSDDSLQNELVKIIEMPLALGFQNENRYYGNEYVYKILRNKNYLTKLGTQYDKKLDDFYKDSEKKNYKLFSDVIDALDKNDVKSAIKQNSSIIPDNLIEENLKIYSEIYLAWLEGNKISGDELKQLEDMAKQCPITGGPAVYQSRTLLGYATNTVIDFPDNCDANNPEKRTSLANQIPERDIKFTLYPNPNDGNMKIEYELKEGENGKLAIYDMTGKLVKEYRLKEGKHNQNIDNKEIVEGIYYYTVIVNGETRKTDKLAIIK